MNPLIDINDPESFNPDVIWWDRIDKRFLVEVRETDDSHIGEMFLFDLDNDSECVFGPEQVGLSFGAGFGADIMDIAEWQMWALDAVDQIIGAPDGTS